MSNTQTRGSSRKAQQARHIARRQERRIAQQQKQMWLSTPPSEVQRDLR